MEPNLKNKISFAITALYKLNYGNPHEGNKSQCAINFIKTYVMT